MKRIRCLNASLIFLCICIFSIQTVTAKTLYDDFSGKYLDSSKWNQGEFVREASGGKLISKIKSSAINTFDRNSTSFQNPASINVIQCDIVVNEATLDTGTDTESFARIDGFFYNSQAAGGATGDVWAGVHIGDRGNGLEVNWEVVEFLADDLSSYDELGRDTITVPGLAYGNTYTVKLEYDGANGFTFTVAGESAIFNTGPARQRDAVTPHKGLTVGAYSNGGSGSGFVSASFDNVQINKATYDDFFTAPLDQTKWQSQEFVREIDNGKVQLISHSTGDRKNTNLSFSEIPPYVEATVRIDSSSVIDPGDRGIARIDGFFYNDTYGPGSGSDYNGYEGNVWVGFYLNYYGDDTLTAACSVDRILDAANTQSVNLVYREFNLPIITDRDYKLSLQFTGSNLRFIIKDTVTGRMDVLGYEISTSVYEPYDEYMSLRSRVYGNSTGGYMAVGFDDVYTDVAEPAATFDATGDWEVTNSNPWACCGCDLPEVGGTTDITITQNGNDINMVLHDDDGDRVLTGDGGWVYGDTYAFKMTEENNGETEITYGIFTLSQNTSGAGNVTFIWTDGVERCESGFNITFTKSAAGGGGGGGGCFISTLIQ